MPKATTTTAKLLPFVLLILEIITFYGVAGWLLGVSNPEYPYETKLYFAVRLCYALGTFTFLIFAIVLPPPIVRRRFIQGTAVFIAVAFPCLFFSQALTDILQLDRLKGNYFNALAEWWDARTSILSDSLIHILGFMAALTLRKLLRPANLRRIKPYLAFTDEP